MNSTDVNSSEIYRPIDVLLVEDNPGDVRLTLEAFKSAKVRNTIHVVNDGAEALSYLKREGDFANVSRPDLILLDLNLPKQNGREVLAKIKSDAELKRIPVVILTTSQAERDIEQSYELHANCFITKPVDLDRFMEIVGSIEDFWLTVVRLPA